MSCWAPIFQVASRACSHPPGACGPPCGCNRAQLFPGDPIRLRDCAQECWSSSGRLAPGDRRNTCRARHDPRFAIRLDLSVDIRDKARYRKGMRATPKCEPAPRSEAVGLQSREERGDARMAERPIVRANSRVVNGRTFAFSQLVREMAIGLREKLRIRSRNSSIPARLL
jgi:hypothetical protein